MSKRLCKMVMVFQGSATRNNIQFYGKSYRESVAGSVIQATGTVKFEDGLWIGNHLKAQNGMQRVRTIPGV